MARHVEPAVAAVVGRELSPVACSILQRALRTRAQRVGSGMRGVGCLRRQIRR